MEELWKSIEWVNESNIQKEYIVFVHWHRQLCLHFAVRCAFPNTFSVTKLNKKPSGYALNATKLTKLQPGYSELLLITYSSKSSSSKSKSFNAQF